ncbi:MAG: hypothetical protein IH582_19370 [Afipia sp.]|nr:hypothetical protein [Afipia sp.]
MLTALGARFEPQETEEMAKLLERLYPHLKRASNFYRGGRGTLASDLDRSLFDSANIAVLIIGEGFRTKTVSAVAQRRIDRGELARLSPLGQIRLRSDDAQSVLGAMLMRTYDGEKSVSISVGGAKMTLIRVEKDQISFYFEGPTVVILVEHVRHLDPEAFAVAYGLSAVEQRALLGIIAGKSVSEIAEEANLSRETIRTQLKGLYAKTGVRGQADLLRLYGRMVGFSA